MRTLLLLFISITSFGQFLPAVISSASVQSPVVSPFDTEANTNDDNQQVWLVIGDSKARGGSPTVNDIGPSPYYQNTVYQYVSPSVTAINSGDVSGAASGSPWMKFAIDYYKFTGYKCVLVPRGVGGSNFYPDGDNNNWYTSGTLYSPAVTAANGGCTAISTTEPRGILMMLGANDERAVTSGAETSANAEIGINSLFSRLRTSFPNTPIYVWLLGRTENGTGGNVTVIRNYILAAVAATTNSFVVADEADFLDGYEEDGLHFSGFGNKYFGALGVHNMLTDGLIFDNPISYSFNSNATTVFSRFTGSEELMDSDKRKLNDFIGSLDTDFALFDAMQVYTLSSQSRSVIDLIRGTSKSVQLTGSISWTQHTGFETPGAITDYVSTNFVASTDGVNYTQNNALTCLFLMIRNTATGTQGSLMGSIGATSNNQVLVFQSTASMLARLNSGTASTITNPTSATHYTTYINRRTTSTQSIGNINTVGASASATSVPPPNRALLLGVRNGGTIDFPFAGEYGFFSAGSASIDNWRLYNKVQELMIDFLINP